MRTWIFQGNPEVFDIEGYLAASSGLIISLADGGPDVLENTAAVCPTHHRFLHHGRERHLIAGQLMQKRELEGEAGFSDTALQLVSPAPFVN